ncbi:hypothetical protein Q3W71_20465 [Micromonospora sp. C28SCA-DRY-2]|uniref:hypothetical protein n=1 Tax=Micromonospora sp. C28SCA-DRY-2 TaxID=3059522 RepID=UPI0026751A9A|nr:hypothetical protein [Micromonospora sp. C28SCA-DRY-2]MDO3704044.1 hypothetical protein [Micromonospora sp. C28SCA-DRY-2]
MTTHSTSNIAQGNAYVGVQANVMTGDVHHHHHAPPDPSSTPQGEFEAGVRYLDRFLLDTARKHIERAVTRGYPITARVQFYRLVALLSGRTPRQLEAEEWRRLLTIWSDPPNLDERDEWTLGLRAILRLLNADDTATPKAVTKELESLPPRQQGYIYNHLDGLLEGALRNKLWQKAVAQAQQHQTAGNRLDRAWKFFHPMPIPPRTRKAAPAVIAMTDRVKVGTGGALLLLATGKLTVLLAVNGEIGGLVGLYGAMAGLAAFGVAGADRHFRHSRRRAKDSELRPPRRQHTDARPGGFAGKIDRLFTRYFARYVPEGMASAQWLAETAGIRRHLRNEVVDAYREERVDAERVAWLVRYLAGDVRTRWTQGTLTAYRQELRAPLSTWLLQITGAITLTTGLLWAASAVFSAAVLPGTLWLALTVPTAITATRAAFRIVAERRRVVADNAYRTAEQARRMEAYHRWMARLADKPTDTEMAAWLECDRKVITDRALQQFRLQPSQVVAHAFLESPARSARKRRAADGPWRYTHYRLLLFLLTEDGVRQIDLELDFRRAAHRDTQRLNYRFHAISAVRIDGLALDKPTFHLTLNSGETITVQVTGTDTDPTERNDDPRPVTDLTLDASGLRQTLHVLEGVAAEGKDWVRHRREQADDRLAELSRRTSGLLD